MRKKHDGDRQRLPMASSWGTPTRRQRELDLSEMAKHARSETGKSIVKEALQGLPRHPRYWNSLTTLFLTGNNLTWLPDSIGTLVSLTELWVSDNKLSVLPDTIGNLPELTLLRANNNNLEVLPTSIGCLRKLQRLHLGRNHLVALPDAICNLRELRELLLSSNNIVHLPDGVGYLQKLTKLHISKNRLRQLPDSIGWLRSLKSCKMDGNANLDMCGNENAVATLVVKLCYVRIGHARWSHRCHATFGTLGNEVFSIAILSANRISWLPPLMWELIFSFFKGEDICELSEKLSNLPYKLASKRKCKRSITRPITLMQVTKCSR